MGIIRIQRLIWLLPVAVVLLASESFAARIVELKIGPHSNYTRVVVVLDQPVKYKSESRGDGLGLQLTVKASGQAETRQVNSAFVESIQIVPGKNGTNIRVRYPKANVRVKKEFVLKNPARIVLDFERGKAQSVSTPKPAPVKEEARKEPPKTDPAKEEIKKEEPKPTPVTEEVNEEEDPKPAEELSLASQSDAADEEEESDEADPDPAALVKKPTPPKTDPAPAEGFQAPRSPVKKSLLDQVKPYAVPAGGVLLLLLLVIGILAKKGKKKRSRAVMEEDSVLDGEPWEGDEDEGAEEEPVMDTEPVSEAQAFAVDSPAPPPPVAPVTGGGAASDSVQELQQKIQQLEDQVNGLMAARERIEAQVKSQTEELRVQRAAIARTQRVVRSLASEDDAPAMAAPKAPE